MLEIKLENIAAVKINIAVNMYKGLELKNIVEPSKPGNGSINDNDNIVLIKAKSFNNGIENKFNITAKIICVNGATEATFANSNSVNLVNFFPIL